MSYLLIFTIISLLILIHEVGHFFAARAVGIPVARFSIGMGPVLWRIKRGETEYCLSLLPLGGYVLPALESEDDFFKISFARRMVFVIGGPFANLVLPLVFAAAINTITHGSSFSGIFIQPLRQVVSLFIGMAAALPAVFVHPEQLSGVVGIVAHGGTIIGTDLLKALRFAAMLSCNFALFNLLPIPALDGGKIVLFLMEKIHPKMAKLNLPLTIAGWAAVLLLMLYVTVHDIVKLI
jgi:regulator of sigma E protease